MVGQDIDGSENWGQLISEKLSHSGRESWSLGNDIWGHEKRQSGSENDNDDQENGQETDQDGNW